MAQSTEEVNKDTSDFVPVWKGEFNLSIQSMEQERK